MPVPSALIDFINAQHVELLANLSRCFDAETPTQPLMQELQAAPRTETEIGAGAPQTDGSYAYDLLVSGNRALASKLVRSQMTAQPQAFGDDEEPEFFPGGDFFKDGPLAAIRSECSDIAGTRRSSWRETMEHTVSPTTVATRSLKHILWSDEHDIKLPHRIEQYMEYVTLALVLLNAFLLTLEFQIEGEVVGKSLVEGQEPKPVAADATNFFYNLDVAFDIMFIIEWAVGAWLAGRLLRFSVDLFANTLLMLVGVVEIILIAMKASGYPISLDVLHVIHAISCLRILRCFRVLRRFKGPQLLLMACNSFLHSLFWAMVFLSLFMTTSALLLGNLLLNYFVQMTSFDDRLWVWERYGTSLRALYTLYEITFSGSWPSFTHPLIEKVHAGLVLFFVLYITVVAFGLIRVITAVFLKDTLDAAANDAEHLVGERLQKKAEYSKKLTAIFAAIDSTGEGLITEENLVEALNKPLVRAYFQTSLDLDVHESKALFHILDDGDGTVTLEEFIDGMLRCKGSARAIDQVVLDRKISRLLMMLDPNWKLRKSPTSASFHMKE